jgi:hypothetical protein
MFVHPDAFRADALRLVESGLTLSEVGRRVGVNRSTLRAWSTRPPETRCPRCWRRETKPLRFIANDYAELLGLYLGDGYVVRTARTYRLRLSLDSSYPKIVGDACDLLARCFPENSVGVTVLDAGATSSVSVYCSHLPCVFPQTGAGKKHERRIELEDWQWRLVEAAPWPFLRGCIRSDGCVFVNRTGRYGYLSYDFKNLSGEIRAMFEIVCDLVGVEYRTYRRHVRICRRDSVELLVRHVGVKS